MAYNFSEFKTRAQDVEEWLKKELASIHTGRATPALLDKVTVEAYGARSPLAHVASINVEDPRTLRITPFDKSQIKDIEAAVNRADLGVSASADSDGLRVFFPELTSERRDSFIRVVRDRLEDARISLRKAREETWDDIQTQEKEGTLTEDEKFRGKEDLQKLVDETNKSLETIADKKETDIKS